jgi:ferritin-like metal-binding protein YciE
MQDKKLPTTMTKIHAQVAKNVTRDRKAAIQKHNDKTHDQSPNFQVVENVLVSKHRKSCASKLQVKWKSPRHITSVESNYVLAVKNLLTKE